MRLGERARGQGILLVCSSPGGSSSLACSFFFSVRILVTQMASDDAGATSGLHEELTFSATQLVVIDRLIAARVVATSVPASAGAHPSSSSSSSSGPLPSDSGKPAFPSRSSCPATHGPPAPEVQGPLGTHDPPGPRVPRTACSPAGTYPPAAYRWLQAIAPSGSCAWLTLFPLCFALGSLPTFFLGQPSRVCVPTVNGSTVERPLTHKK